MSQFQLAFNIVFFDILTLCDFYHDMLHTQNMF